MISFDIPWSLLVHRIDEAGYSGVQLHAAFKEWLAIHASNAHIHLGIVRQYIRFYDFNEAALAKLTWGLTDESVTI